MGEDVPSKSLIQYIPNFANFQPNSPSISAHVSGRLETAARSPTPTVDANVCNPASNTVLKTTVVANLEGSNFLVSVTTKGSCRANGFGTITTGDPGGEAAPRD